MSILEILYFSNTALPKELKQNAFLVLNIVCLPLQRLGIVILFNFRIMDPYVYDGPQLQTMVKCVASITVCSCISRNWGLNKPIDICTYKKL